MTKKDFEAAAHIVQEAQKFDGASEAEAEKLADAFVRLFRADNNRFDEARFRRACVQGANVRARS